VFPGVRRYEGNKKNYTMRAYNERHKATVFIPLIGYMVIFNTKVLPVFQLSKYIFGNQNNQTYVSWRLLAIYFGLCFLIH
jgi:hypothetical protein